MSLFVSLVFMSPLRMFHASMAGIIHHQTTAIRWVGLMALVFPPFPRSCPKTSVPSKHGFCPPVIPDIRFNLRTIRNDVSFAMPYHPQPIDTSGVSLSPELLALTEKLAEHAHDLWALQRSRDGWSHGATRNDAAKQHPCLVPYADLPESEKEYDRQAALGTLKAILALGWEIRTT